MAGVLDINAVRKLSVEERLRIVEQIMATIGEADDAPFSDAQWAEIQRRLSRYESDPGSAPSYEQYKALIRSLA